MDPANKADITITSKLVHSFRKPKQEQGPITITFDKGYDSRENRAQLIQFGFNPIIPYIRRNSSNSQPELSEEEKRIYKKRIVVEHYYGILKQFRTIQIRYERKLSHFTSLIDLADASLIANKLENFI